MIERIPDRIKIFGSLIMNSPIEVLFVFDKQFRLVESHIGEQLGILTTRKQMEKWKDLYTLHNHSKWPLTVSIPDIGCAAEFNLIGTFIVIGQLKRIDYLGRIGHEWHSDFRFHPWWTHRSIFKFATEMDARERPLVYNDILETILLEYPVEYLKEYL